MLAPILLVAAIVCGAVVTFAVGFVIWIAREQRQLMDEREAEAKRDPEDPEIDSKLTIGNASTTAASATSAEEQVRVFAYDGNPAHR